MAQAIINIGERQDRVLTIIKGKFGFKNKSDAVNFVIQQYEEEMLEPELRPELIEKLRKIKSQNGEHYKSLDEFKRRIENA